MNTVKKDLINSKWIEKGVKILDPMTTYIDESVVIEENVTIYPNCFIEGSSLLKNGCMIGVNSKIVNSTIGENTKIESSWIINSEVGNDTTIGPMSHIREHCKIGNNVRIGNFVEMKKVNFGNGSKCAHLTYLGDADVGEKCNFGCGVVTANYDGKNKSLTKIEDNAFIGCNSNLVAPVTVKKNAFIAAGSTITKDVEEDAMGIARAKQVNKEGYSKVLEERRMKKFEELQKKK